jgi:hypothetical protein
LKQKIERNAEVKFKSAAEYHSETVFHTRIKKMDNIWARGGAQTIELPLSKCEALSSNSSTGKNFFKCHSLLKYV